MGARLEEQVVWMKLQGEERQSGLAGPWGRPRNRLWEDGGIFSCEKGVWWSRRGEAESPGGGRVRA